ncbi:YhjD/YihY/BrkB family envelope integrity protein [Solwaraspora sp. WMMD1047]|uniref:YhjD/YihY/BrkB family envelope integrity protein n=1 Tax=Solwaraspora sp. WMMD1047 TaxID=3016102 RepID=UPI0024178DEC|nr:YhjD/YihY/BrkB family envelope integrity protein [Solwaraspora sp. WMMD1047]MDG4829582.1 YhjD/YihY/BrkB family envelope integrity protein [Solwaraspora sp. WMMD1047]
MGLGWQRVRRISRAAFRPVRGRDLSLHAAAITFYSAIAVVPVALLAIWLTGLAAGADRVRQLTAYAIETLPDAIGADRATAALIDAGLHLTPAFALAALLPASLYGEGLRRAFVSVADPPGPDESLVGWRGRLLLLPLLAPAPALLLSILLALPLTTRLFRQGGWQAALGVVLSFLAVWLVLTPVLIWVFRVVGPGRPDWLSTVGLGSFTAANLSGFLHGFVLFCSLPLDLGLPFGGFEEVGAGVAVLLWLYLFHVIVLAGYSATLALSRWRRRRRPAAPMLNSGTDPAPRT